MGAPGMIMVLADNQLQSSKTLGEQGIFINLGNSEMLSISEIQSALKSLITDHVQRKRLRQKSRSLVDGQGVFRVVNYLLTWRGND